MGKPVLFGPHMHHFEDIKETFLSENAAICVRDKNEFFETALRLLEDPAMARSVGESARRVVEANRGATERYFQALERYL
jgi:3-deoxy-D-manno-octulosonic-acid transferase